MNDIPFEQLKLISYPDLTRACTEQHVSRDGFHRMSFSIIISACSAPTQANVPVAGLQNVVYMAFKGESIKLFPQFATP